MMATLGVEPGANPWSSIGPSPPPQSQHYQQSVGGAYYGYNLQAKNHVDLSRDRLILVLNYFSYLLASAFNNRPLRLVVHGGACMLLHPGVYALSLEQKDYLPRLPHRNKTRDVDIIQRSFATEMAQLGVVGAAEKLKQCILATAQHFNLGADWMNSDADIALPMATGPNGTTYDPIYAAAVQPDNIELHTIYHSPNGMLTLISVTPFWAVALKLVRYSPQDAADICLLLRNGTKLSRTNWSADLLRDWLFTSCWPMGYQHYDLIRLRNINHRIHHALQTLAEWSVNEAAHPGNQDQNAMAAAFSSVNVAPTPIHNGITPLAAMGGGGEVIGGENAMERGWKPSWPSETGPWHPAANADGRRRSRSHSAKPSPTTPPGEFAPPHHDPSDFGLVPPSQDAAANLKKAKKKAKAEKKSKGNSLSAPASSAYLSPPPPYPGQSAPIYGSPYNPSGYISDREATGLTSLRDLEWSLDQHVGHLLANGSPNLSGQPSWRRPEKLKKSSSKDKEKEKRKREKERERTQEREKNRMQKQISPWDYAPPPIVPFEDVRASSSDDDSDYASTDADEDDTVYVRNMSERHHPHSGYASPQRSPPKPVSQGWGPEHPQSTSNPLPQTRAHSKSSQSADAPFIPPTYATHLPSQSFYAQPSHSSHAPYMTSQPPQASSKSHKPSPLNLSQTWHASTYPGMQAAGPAPAPSRPPVSHQGPSSIPPPHAYYTNPLRDIQNVASRSDSRQGFITSGPPVSNRRHEEKAVEPFIPPADMYNDYRPPRAPY